MKFLLILLISFNSVGMAKKSIPSVINERNNNNSFVNVTKFNGFKRSEIDNFWIYSEKLNKTISSQCFKDFILSADLRKTNGKTNQQVLNDILTKRVNVELTMYYSKRSTVGYTYPNTPKIWFNRKFHSNFSYCKSASNLAHEASHKIGYGHSKRYHINRPKSVPYSINSGFDKCCLE